MSTEITQTTTHPMMTKQEAEEKHAQIIQLSAQYIDMVGPMALEMREREGWRALGFKNWTNYCQHVDEQISAVNVMRLAQKAEVEQNVQARLPMRHALVLARLPSPDARVEVFKEVKANVAHPIERNYQTYVDRWLRKHDQPADSGGKRKDDSDGWTNRELEDDGELATALDRIETVYSSGERKAIQNGTIGLSRKDIIGLAAFHASKMKEVRNLIMANHWDVAMAIKFVNKQICPSDRIEELLNRCLITPELYYACSVAGYDIQIKARPAQSSKIKALRSKVQGQAFRVSVRDLGAIF
jgi:hypothetical protein